MTTCPTPAGSGQGPGAEARAGSGSHVQAIAYDVGGRELAQALLEGPNGYDLTGRFLAWGAGVASFLSPWALLGLSPRPAIAAPPPPAVVVQHRTVYRVVWKQASGGRGIFHATEVGGAALSRNGIPVVQTAQAMRASLLASATAALLWPRRRSS